MGGDGRAGARPSRAAVMGRADARERVPPAWPKNSRGGGRGGRAALLRGRNGEGGRAGASRREGRAPARPQWGATDARERVPPYVGGSASLRWGFGLPTLGVRPPYVGGLASLRLEKTFPPLRVQGADARERVPPADATGTLGTRGTWGADAQERVPPALPGGGAIAAYGKCGRKTDGVIGCVVSLPAGIMV